MQAPVPVCWVALVCDTQAAPTEIPRWWSLEKGPRWVGGGTSVGAVQVQAIDMLQNFQYFLLLWGKLAIFHNGLMKNMELNVVWRLLHRRPVSRHISVLLRLRPRIHKYPGD